MLAPLVLIALIPSVTAGRLVSAVEAKPAVGAGQQVDYTWSLHGGVKLQCNSGVSTRAALRGGRSA